MRTNFQQAQLPVPKQLVFAAVRKAKKHLEQVVSKQPPDGISSVPEEPLPWQHGHRAVGSPRVYGMTVWGDLFTARQRLGLVKFTREISALSNSEHKEILGLVLSKLAELSNSLCPWEPFAECPRHIFSRQAIPIAWDFAEGVVISNSSGGFETCCDNVASSVRSVVGCLTTASPQVADATASPLPDDACAIWFTDPPYWDNVAYSDLSDFFFVWLKRAIPNHVLMHPVFDSRNPLTPKARELTVTTAVDEHTAPKNGAFFLQGITKAFSEGQRVVNENGVGCVIFAHKTTEGWEALLSGMTRAGWVITASWPITTEMKTRMVARDTASLAASIHLVCRPRPEDALVGDWGEVLRDLPKRVGDWMERLQGEGVRGADLVFACIGPALEIYSRYSKVVDAEEREIPLGGDPEASEPHRRGFLSYVWEVVGRTALEQVLETADLPTPRLRQAGAQGRDSAAGLPAGVLTQAGALEEDARLTALFLWTLQSTNGNGAKAPKEESENDEETDEEEESPKKKKQGYSLIFDVVRRFAQPLGIHLPGWEGRVIETEKGVVRLLSVKERGKQLFGEESVSAAGFKIEEKARRDPQMKFDFAVSGDRTIPEIKGRRPRKKKEMIAESSQKAGVTTTLDRVHAAMLLQASGQTNALRALLKAEQDRSPDFLRLANALSALYPKQSEEKRLLDAMLLAMPR
jgi:putative DNA methylase